MEYNYLTELAWISSSAVTSLCVKDFISSCFFTRPQHSAPHGWDRAMQAQASAYQHNMQRGHGGPGGFQQHVQRRDDRRPQEVRICLSRGTAF